MRQYIDESETLRRDLMSQSLDDLRAQRAALEARGNELMGDDDCWEYNDLSKVDNGLVNDMTDYDAAIVEVQKLVDYLVELSETKGRTDHHQLGSRLRLAASAGRSDHCLTLLAHGADVNATDHTGWTPLQSAAANGHPSVCALLLLHGAELRPSGGLAGFARLGKFGLSPLQLAVYYGNTEVVDYLVSDHGEELDQRTGSGESLMDIAQLKPDNGAMVVHLMVLRSEISISSAEMALDAAFTGAGGDAPHSVRVIDCDAALEALEDGEEDLTDDELNTELRHAAQLGLESKCRACLDEGADIDDASTTGWTPLRLAAANGHTQICALLLSLGADLDVKRRGDLSVFQLAVWHGQVDVVEYFVRERGESLDQLTDGGRTLIELAQSSEDNEEMATYLLSRRCEATERVVDEALNTLNDESAPPPRRNSSSLSL
jgi:ankyrin repeat protein